MIIQKTGSFCFECNKIHPAEIEIRGNEVYFRVYCPRGRKETKISDDAEIFMHFRSLAPAFHRKGHGYRGAYLFRYVEITDACNFSCPICYANSGGKRKKFVSLEYVEKVAEKAKREGAVALCITGGEPTLHPELPRMVELLKTKGLRPVVLTNGFLFYKKPEMMDLLKEKGLWGVTVQFDTFNPQIHRMMRGNEYIEEKIRVMEMAVKKGLRLSVTMTVIRENLREIKDVILHALSFSPGLYLININITNPAGRFMARKSQLINRETVIKELISDMGLNVEDFLPLPSVAPLQLSLHPDCGAFLFLLKDDKKVMPVTRLVNVKNLYLRLSSLPESTHPVYSVLFPLLSLFKYTDPGKRSLLLSALAGTLKGRGKRSIVTVAIGDFLTRDYMDVERLRVCGGIFLTPRGAYPGCYYVYKKYGGAW